MATPESKVKDAVKKMLKEYKAYQHWPVQTGYGAPTLDCIACVAGLYIAIETKAPGKKPTPRQLLTMEEINNAGGITLVVDGDLTELEATLKNAVVMGFMLSAD